MLAEWTALDKTALCVMLAVAIWFIKFLLVLIKDIFIKKQGEQVPETETHEFIIENRKRMDEAVKKIQARFDLHDARILHVENRLENMCKEPFCPTHKQTVQLLDSMTLKMDSNASKIDTVIATLNTMREMGAIHSHPK